MRRTATLSIAAKEKDNNLANIDHIFSLNKKCKLELGILNTIPNYTYTIQNKKTQNNEFYTINYKELYGDIIWFPLGIYVMFNPSLAHGTDGITISMQLKDKMCLLNGDVAGQIHSGVDFTSQEEITDGTLLQVDRKYTLVYNIIKELVHHWGNEQLNKIIISEVPEKIKMAVKWTGKDSVYLVPIVEKDGSGTQSKIQTINWQFQEEPKQADYYLKYQPYYDVGFVYEDFTYPGELVCNPGETVTSILDKIINILGNYEYFYDVYGNFIFRQKQNYLNMTNVAYWTKERAVLDNTIQEDIAGNLPTDQYQADVYRLSKSTYRIDDNHYVININNSVNFNNIKNDFVVWGAFKNNSTNYTNPCRFHLAIDKKPSLNAHNDIIFYKDDLDIVRGICITDQSKLKDDKIIIGGSEYEVIEKYENRYSIDWRQQIYYQMLQSEAIGTETNTELNNTYFYYYAELKEQFPKIFDLTSSKKVTINGKEYNIANGWTKTTIQTPEQIGYYLDFIDENSELGQFSVSNIGRRSIIINQNQNINCVFEPAIPDIVYIDVTKLSNEELENERRKLQDIGQRYLQIPTYLYDQLATGGFLNSCYEKIKDLLYQYTHVNNSISISTIPIYHLEPGSRISIYDRESGIDDDFIIQSISIPLDVSSTMNINAYKALQKI